MWKELQAEVRGRQGEWQWRQGELALLFVRLSAQVPTSSQVPSPQLCSPQSSALDAFPPSQFLFSFSLVREGPFG